MANSKTKVEVKVIDQGHRSGRGQGQFLSGSQLLYCEAFVKFSHDSCVNTFSYVPFHGNEVPLMVKTKVEVKVIDQGQRSGRGQCHNI